MLIRALIDRVEFDCECRARLEEAPERLTVRAGQHRARIGAILGFLQEVGDLQ